MSTTPTKPESVYDDKSFAETLFQDAFNPGVHAKSLDITNYVLAALLVSATITFILWDYSIHFIIILFMAGVLTVLMNVHRGAILEASAEFFKQEAIKEEEKRVESMKKYEILENSDDEDVDGEFETLYVDEGVELTPEKIEELLAEQRKKKSDAKKKD